jgi:AraC-like DNA-binding protein
MPIVGRGRIVVWQGASLWVFAGTTDHARTDFHSHHAIQVTFALEGQFELRTLHEAQAGPIVAVSPNAEHVFEAHGVAAHLFIEPDGAVGRSLASMWFAQSALKPLVHGALASLISELKEIFHAGAGNAALIAIGEQLIQALASNVQESAPESRVSAMIGFIAEKLDEPLTLPMIADHVGLSAGRASHLFVEQTGLQPRTYVLWRRVAKAVELRSSGASLTEAAHAAGFADSAHLSRTFRRMFGLSANSLLVQRA